MTVFEKLMENMTAETMAELGTRLVNVDNRQLYYMTSSGQMFAYTRYQEALNHEYQWLLQKLPEPEKADTEKASPKEGTKKTNK